MVQVGNFLYSVHGVTVSGRSVVRWTIADATTYDIVQQGTISDPTLSFFFPSLAVNSVRDVVVGFSGSDAEHLRQHVCRGGRLRGRRAPGGSLQCLDCHDQTKAGTDGYPDTRWGDYSAVQRPTQPILASSGRIKETRQIDSRSVVRYLLVIGPRKPVKSSRRRRASDVGRTPRGAVLTPRQTTLPCVAPLATDHVIFSRAGTTYAVAFSGQQHERPGPACGRGAVTWNLPGASYSLTNSSPAAPSLVRRRVSGHRNAERCGRWC